MIDATASRRDFLRHAGGVTTGGLLAGTLGGAVAGLVAAPAAADTALDIQILQTASALEALTVNTYQTAIGLDFIKNGNKVLLSFLETTGNQHREHGMAFRAQTMALGGAEQPNAHPGGQQIVDAATPDLTDSLKVVQLAEQLETIATHTYLENTTLLDDTVARQLMATVMGVDTQHAAVLRVFAALLAAESPELIALPVDPAALPAAAGSVATPDAVEPSTNALTPDSGVLQPVPQP